MAAGSGTVPGTERRWRRRARRCGVVLWRVWGEISEDRVFALAAGVAYYTLLALFPAIGVFVSLYGLVADVSTVQRNIEDLAFILPSGGLEIIAGQMQRIASQPPKSLGLTFFAGLAISLWSANAGVKAMFDALNVAYDEEERRGFIRLNLVSLLFTLCAIGFAALALAVVVAAPIALKFIGFGSEAGTLIRLLRWPALYLATIAALTLVYRYGPGGRREHWLNWGGVIAATVWLGGSMLFSWYVARFANYGATYGSLGAVIGFLTWIWLSTVIFLIGAELNSEIERERDRRPRRCA
ncbi:YihY/virulence factor BrkB family protein [Inquilinus limosus]|uniref:YihY/virulence factor BrkB family protein n=1 Tax=Inquilinus limosus TaxID=171674 RepID=UPI003F158171